MRAHLSAREAINGDDQVGILLDTFHLYRSFGHVPPPEEATVVVSS